MKSVKEVDDVLLLLVREASAVHVVIVKLFTTEFDILGTTSRQVKLFSYPVRLQVLLSPGVAVLSLKQNTKYDFEIRRADGSMKL